MHERRQAWRSSGRILSVKAITSVLRSSDSRIPTNRIAWAKTFSCFCGLRPSSTTLHLTPTSEHSSRFLRNLGSGIAPVKNWSLMVPTSSTGWSTTTEFFMAGLRYESIASACRKGRGRPSIVTLVSGNGPSGAGIDTQPVARADSRRQAAARGSASTLSIMRESYFHFPSRDNLRRAWIALQVSLMLPFMFSVAIVLEMAFAQPGKGYRSPAGVDIACEPLAPRAKIYSAPRCARFGSMETNPQGFGLALASLALLSGGMWLSCRPGCGLRFARRG